MFEKIKKWFTGLLGAKPTENVTEDASQNFSNANGSNVFHNATGTVYTNANGKDIYRAANGTVFSNANIYNSFLGIPMSFWYGTILTLLFVFIFNRRVVNILNKTHNVGKAVSN